MAKLLKLFRRKEKSPEEEIRLYQERQEHLNMVGNALIPDEVPMSPPIGYVKQPSMVEIIQAQVRNAIAQEDRDKGIETFEDADDFDVGDPDELPRSVYEMEEHFDPLLRERKGRFLEEQPDKKTAPKDPDQLEKKPEEPPPSPAVS